MGQRPDVGDAAAAVGMGLGAGLVDLRRAGIFEPQLFAVSQHRLSVAEPKIWAWRVTRVYGRGRGRIAFGDAEPLAVAVCCPINAD